MSNEVLFSGAFLILILVVLSLDLGVFNRKSHEVSFKEATAWTLVWTALSFLVYLFIRLHGDMIHGVDSIARLQEINIAHGHGMKIDPSLGLAANVEAYRNVLSLEFLTGYLIEYALSVDNIFVIIMLFMSFSVPKAYFHRVLFWGILGAIVMRFVFIFLSAALIQRFDWVMWIFGGLLIFTGIKMYLDKDKEEKMNVAKHPVVRFASKYFAVHPHFVKDKFFTRQDHKWMMTPLFLVVLVVEFSDVLFAVDSVPAIFSVTKDPYIVFASNICAILGLRSLFFLISNVMNLFHYLKVGLAVLLTFIGVKMLLGSVLHIHIGTIPSLLAIVGILGVSMLASVIFPQKKAK
jgi:tellurite resistance protein TerC